GVSSALDDMNSQTVTSYLLTIFEAGLLGVLLRRTSVAEQVFQRFHEMSDRNTHGQGRRSDACSSQGLAKAIPQITCTSHALINRQKGQYVITTRVHKDSMVSVNHATCIVCKCCQFSR